MESNTTHKQLRQLIADHFNRQELTQLCFDLNVDHDEIASPNAVKSEAIDGLLVYFAKRKRQTDLIQALRQERPLVEWPETYTVLIGVGQSDILDDETSQIYLNRYLTRLEKEVSRVHVLGRRQATPLENVYTHVNLLEKPAADQRYNISQLSEEASPRDFSNREKRISGEAAVSAYDKLFILGKPGTGKTTFLKHTSSRAIKGDIKRIPIFVTLKELSDSGLEIVPFIVQELGLKRYSNAEIFVEDWLSVGQAIVLFDGLDEVNTEDKSRLSIQHALNKFVKNYSECAILITCRVAADEYSLEQFQYVEMADFDEVQISHYIEQWFSYDKKIGHRCKDALLKKEETKPIRELIQVPLMLSLVCIVFEEKGEISEKRHQLYEEATDALLVYWDESRFIDRDQIYKALTPEHKKGILAHIAFHTFEKGEYFLPEKRIIALIDEYTKKNSELSRINGKRILQIIEAHHGILVERARRIHSFSHLTLQEYFTARYIVDNEQRGTITQLMLCVMDDRWREVVKLTAGMLGDAAEFFEQYLGTVALLQNEDRQLIQLLQWAARKNTLSKMSYKPSAMRAVMLYQIFARACAHAYSHSLILASTRDHDLDRALDRAHGAAIALARAFDRTYDRGKYINKGLGQILDRQLKTNLILARNLASEHDQGLAHDLDHVLASARDLAHTLDYDLAFNRTRVHDRELTHDRELARDRTLALVRDLAHALAYDRKRVHNRERNLAFARDMARDLALNLDLDLDRVHDLAFASPLDLAMDPAYTLAHSLDRTLSLDIDLALDNVHERIRERDLALQVANRLNLVEFRLELEGLKLPGDFYDVQVIRAFSRELFAIINEYADKWNPYLQATEDDLRMVPAKLDVLHRYLKATLLLAQCLQNSYVADRKAIENQILKPINRNILVLKFASLLKRFKQ